MLKWIARRAQVAALEQEVTTLSEHLSTALDRNEAETVRSAALVDRIEVLERQRAVQDDLLSAIEDRLARTEEKTRRIDAERSGTADYLDRMIVRYDGHHEEVDQLRTDLARLVRRFDLHADDMTRTATALLHRIERTRPAS